MIVDNADDVDVLYAPDSRLADELLPRSTHGSIFMKTRDKKVGVRFSAGPQNEIVIPAMTMVESESLLVAKLGDIESEGEWERTRPNFG